jgi:hypothetical protein
MRLLLNRHKLFVLRLDLQLRLSLAIFVVIKATMRVTVERKKQHALQQCHELLTLKMNVTA